MTERGMGLYARRGSRLAHMPVMLRVVTLHPLRPPRPGRAARHSDQGSGRVGGSTVGGWARGPCRCEGGEGGGRPRKAKAKQSCLHIIPEG